MSDPSNRHAGTEKEKEMSLAFEDTALPKTVQTFPCQGSGSWTLHDDTTSLGIIQGGPGPR